MKRIRQRAPFKNLKYYIIFLLVYVFQTPPVQAQPIIWPHHLPGNWQQEGKPRSYSGHDLTIYLDGGADIFLEMGFHALSVQFYRNGSDEIIGEVYEMTGKPGAWGMFYRLRHKDGPAPHLGPASAFNNWQILLVRDSVLVRIANYSGKPKCREAMQNLAEMIGTQLPASSKEPQWSALLPEEGQIPSSRRIIRGPLSLREVTTLFTADQLRLSAQAIGISASYRKHGSSFRILIIRYKNRQIPDQVIGRLEEEYKLQKLTNNGYRLTVKGQLISIALKNSDLWLNIKDGSNR